MPASVNLAKNLVGSGILSLPAGVAAFSMRPAALGPSLLLLAVAACLSAYSFYLIGKVCEETRASSFGGAWEGSVKRGKWVPQLICILECFGGSVVYAMVLGDVFSSIAQSVGFLPGFLAARSSLIIAISAVLYPLCCLRSFDSLAKFSLLGTLASSYVVAFVTKRFLDGSYALGGAYHLPLSASVSASAASHALINPQMLILISILSTAFLVHFNAPQFYTELQPARPGLTGKEKTDKLQRFKLVSLLGFGMAALQYALVMVFGFLTFGSATQGNVLLNYAASDPLATFARVAVGISMLFGYPMQFAGFRDGILEMCRESAQLPKAQHRLVTAGLLAVAVAVACAFRDLGQFQAIEGALLAAFLIYTAPPIMALSFGRGKRLGLRALAALGAVVGAVGCAVNAGWV